MIDLIHNLIPEERRVYPSDQYLANNYLLRYQEYRNLRALRLPSTLEGADLGYSFLMLKHWLIDQIVSEVFGDSPFIADPKELASQLTHDLHTHLMNDLMGKSILYEFEKLFAANLLGKVKSEGFLIFSTQTANDPDWQDFYFETYPVLVSKLNLFFFQHFEFLKEFLGHLNEVKSEVIALIPTRELLLAEIKMFKGDHHNNGRHTLCFKLTNGQLFYYKPRSLKADIWFNQELQRCFGSGTPLHFICREQFGIMPHIEQETLASQADVQQYYYHFGQFMGLSYLLNATDLIDENIIAAKVPVVIDAECAVTPLLWGKLSPSETKHALRVQGSHSIAQTSLVPVKFLAEETFHCPLLAAPTENAEVRPDLQELLGREINLITGHSTNTHLPQFDGKTFSYHQYSSELLSGFTEFLNDQPKINLPNNTTFRFINRNTTVYVSLLAEATKPYYLEDIQRYQELFASVLDKEINQSEYYQLLHGDVPYFHFSSEQPSIVFDALGFKYELPRSPDLKTMVVEKQNNVKRPFGLQNQINYIEASLRFTTGFKEQFSTIISPIQQSIPRIAPALRDAILEALLRQGIEDDGAFFFPTLHYSNAGDQHTELTISNPSVYEGIGGIALVLGKLRKAKQLSASGKKVLLKLKRQIAEGTEKALENTSNVAGMELPAYSYVFWTLYGTGSNQAGSLLPKVKKWLLQHIANDPMGDFLVGSTSLVNFVLSTRELDPSFSAALVEKYLANVLAKVHFTESDEAYWCFHEDFDGKVGFAHGTAGFLFTLSKINLYYPALAATYQIPWLLDCCFNSIVGLYDPANQQWFETRKKEQLVNCNYNHGEAGIALGLMAYYACKPDPQILEYLRICNRHLNASGNQILFTLSNGWLGNYLVQKQIKAFFDQLSAFPPKDYVLLSAMPSHTLERWMEYTFKQNASLNYSLFTGLFGFIHLSMVEEGIHDLDFLTFSLNA